MKRLSNLYDAMISYSNALFVYDKIRRNCRNKKKVFEFIKYKNCYIIDILEKLRNCSYKFSNFSIFLIHEKKYRIIMSENIADKVVNQMVSYFILEPTLKNLIDTNVATRKNKGTSYAYEMIEKYIRSLGLNKRIYVLKIDINKYFYNIDHDVLYSMLKKRIKDTKSLNIIKQIIDLTDDDYVNDRIKKLVDKEIDRIRTLNISLGEKEKKIFELRKIPLYAKGKGLSIGCLSNQLLAIFYLNDVDHYIKEELKHKYYIRYMDDLYIFDTDIEKLKKSFSLIVRKINGLKLTINNKSGIYDLKNGITFLGYTYSVRRNGFLIKYSNVTIRKINKKLRKLYKNDFNSYYCSLNSYKGYFVRCNTSLYYDKYKLIELNNRFDKYRMLKKKYGDNVVFIKYKNRYYTYGDDLRYVNNILKTKYKSFNYRHLVRVIRKINDYVILSGNMILVNQL